MSSFVSLAFAQSAPTLSLRRFVIINFDIGGIPHVVKTAYLVKDLVKQLPIFVVLEFVVVAIFASLQDVVEI